MSTPLKRRRLEFSTPATSSMVQGNASTVSKGKKKFSSGKKSKKLANFIKAVVQGQAEKKEADTVVSFTMNATQSNVQLISGCSQGTTGSNHVGDEIKHMYVEVDLSISNSVVATNSTGPFAGDTGFWAIVLDRQPDGALAAFTDIFDANVTPGTAFRVTTKNQERFKILSRNEWAVGCSGATLGGTAVITGAMPYHIKEFIDLSKLRGNDAEQHFNAGTTGAITAIDSNCLLFVIGGSTSDADNTTVMIGQTKYRFTDI